MSIAKAIHPVVGLGPLSNADLEKTAGAIHTGVYFSGNFTAPPPPIDEATFKAQLDRFSASTIAAADGSRKAIAESKKERQLLLRMIRQLGHYVEANCKDDMATFLSSGFKPIQRKGAKQPVATPHILGVANGSTGQMIVRSKSSRNAYSFQVRYAANGAGGTPGTWTTESFTNPRAMAIYGLTPGTTYTFQVRALGSLGQSDWSDVATRICQ
jgi:hypothetical protein